MPLLRSLTKRPLAAFGILLSQVWHTGHRPDLPSLTNQDPSAVLGDPANPPLRIVLLGDSSITAPGVHPLDDCWARRVGHHLAEDYHVTLINLASGGTRAADLLKYQVPAAIAHAPDMALVSVGANDALRSVAVIDYERDLTQILDRLSDHIPAVGITGIGDLGPLPRLPTIGRAWARVRARSFDRSIARVAHKLDVPRTITWGPIWDAFEDPRNENSMYAADLFHASGKGHAYFAMAWLEVTDVLLERLGPRLSARAERHESSK